MAVLRVLLRLRVERRLGLRLNDDDPASSPVPPWPVTLAAAMASKLVELEFCAPPPWATETDDEVRGAGGGGGPRAAEGTSNWICKSSGLLELDGGGRTSTNRSAGPLPGQRGSRRAERWGMTYRAEEAASAPWSERSSCVIQEREEWTGYSYDSSLAVRCWAPSWFEFKVARSRSQMRVHSTRASEFHGPTPEPPFPAVSWRRFLRGRSTRVVHRDKNRGLILAANCSETPTRCACKQRSCPTPGRAPLRRTLRTFPTPPRCREYSDARFHPLSRSAPCLPRQSWPELYARMRV